MQSIDGVQVPFMPVGGVKELKKQTVPLGNSSAPANSFEDIFRTELNKLKFSAHAQARLTSRDINLSDGELNRLESAVNKADGKGAADALIMLDEKAFIVNVPNKTVVTVVDKSQMQSNVITNIDSAVFA